jgi:hypothetical protein
VGVDENLLDVDNDDVADMGFGPSQNAWNDAERCIFCDRMCGVCVVCMSSVAWCVMRVMCMVRH